MALTVGNMKIEISVNSQGVVTGMATAKSAVKDGVDSMQGAMSSLKGQLLALGGAFSVGALVAYTRSIIEAADAMNDLSQRVGISVKDLAKYELAANQSGTSMEALAKGIKGIAGNLMEHGEALKKAGISATTADGAMQQLADLFAAMPDNMEKTTLATKLVGKSGMELIPMLNLGSQGLADAAEKSAKYAEQMAIMAPLADAFNDNMATLAMVAKTSSSSLMTDMLPAMVTISAAMAQAAKDTGLLGAAWEGMSGIGERMINKLSTKFLEFNAWIDESNAKLMRFFGQDSEADKLMNAANERYLKIQKMWGASGGQGATPATTTAANTNAMGDWLAKYKAMMAALGGDGGKTDSALKARESFIAALQKESDTLQWGTTQAKLNEAAKLGITGKELALVKSILESNDAYKEALQMAKARADLRKKESDGIETFMQAQTEAYNAAVKGSEDALKAAQKEYDQYGLSKSQIAELTLLTLQSTQAKDADGIEGAKAIQKQIDAQKELIGVLQKGEVRDAAKTLADDNRKAAEESGKYWEDALMRAFESGKGFFESLWDTIKNTLKTQVLKVLVTGTLSGLGLTGAASAAGSASGGLIGSAAGSFATSTGLSAFGGAFSAGIGGGMEAFGAGIEMMSSATGLSSAMAGLGQSMGAALPYVGAVIAAFTVLKNLGVFGSNFISATDSGRARVDYSAAGLAGAAYATTGDASQISGASKNVESLAQSYFKTAAALGIKAMNATFEYGTNTGEEGSKPQTVLGVNIGSMGYSSGEVSSADSAGLQLAASRAVLTALKASSIPKYLQNVFNGITASTATQEQISATLNYAASLKTLRTALTETRTPIEVLSDTVRTGFAQLGTSAETFKTDFVAAIDAGISADTLAQWQALGTAVDQLGSSVLTAADNIRKMVAGISASVSDSIFNMQYGLEDNQGKYDMLRVRGARIDDQMRSTTDIYSIGKLAEDQIALLNKAWGLLDPAQQAASMVVFEDKLTAIDDFVKTKGADPVALARAQAKEAADTMAAAVKTAVAEALAQPASDISSAAQDIQAAASTPSVANISVTVRAPQGQEVNIQ